MYMQLLMWEIWGASHAAPCCIGFLHVLRVSCCRHAGRLCKQVCVYCMCVYCALRCIQGGFPLHAQNSGYGSVLTRIKSLTESEITFFWLFFLCRIEPNADERLPLSTVFISWVSISPPVSASCPHCQPNKNKICYVCYESGYLSIITTLSGVD